MDVKIISKPEDILDFDRTVSMRHSSEYSVDLEGDNLSRHGKINYIQIYAVATNKIFIFDCANLEKTDVKRVLSPIFDDASIAKYMFDCRSDVDALYHQYDIKLTGVLDLQLYEIAYRKCTCERNQVKWHKYYNGLKKTLAVYGSQVGITSTDLEIKEKFTKQFIQKNYALDLNDSDVVRYLAIDIIFLDRLYNIYHPIIDDKDLISRIVAETEKRQNHWQKPEFINDKSNAISAI